MTADDHRRAAELFSRVRELPQREQAAALDAACEGNAELRARVVRLLDADRDVTNGSFLDRPAMQDAARLISPEPPRLPSPGTVVGNYRLGGRIGAGGMGIVYEADDLHLGRRVAVKILPPTLGAEGDERIQRFQREARAASRLNHPHIVSIFDADFDAGWYFIAMEFVEGKTLRELIRAEPKGLDAGTVLEIIGQTASALSAAHEAGIVHRDIKPENIMVRPDGLVKVLDFGLARIGEPTDGGGTAADLRTRPGQLAGTIQYVSPEQVRGKGASARSDLFSLGVVAYELATGVRPFDGPTDGAIFEAILNLDPAPPSAIRPALGAQLDSMVLQALEKDPELRFQTARDLCSACKRLTRDSSRTTIPSMPHPAGPTGVGSVAAAPAQTKRPRGIQFAVGAVFLILLTACVWMYLALRGRNQAPQQQAAGPQQSTLLAALPGYEFHPALSPDARKLAFVWNGNGSNYDIYVKSVDAESAPRRLTSNEEEDLNPTWSPDATQIAFLRISPTRRQILVIPAEGGPERLVAEIHPVSLPWVQEASIIRRTPGPDWSPDGKWLAVTDRCSAEGTSDCVYLISPDGTQRRRVTSGAPIGDYAPRFSPDGKRIAFLRTVADVGEDDIYTADVTGGSEARVTTDNQQVMSVAWAVDHRLYFVSNRNGNNLLWSIPETGGQPRLVAGVSGDALSVSAAPAANAIAWAQSYRNTNIWRTDISSPGGRAEMIISSSRNNHSPQYSPDGRQIVFISDRTGGPEIWVANADGSDPHHLTFSSRPRSIGSPNWSPDGKQFVYDSVVGSRSQLFLMSVDGTNQRQFTTDSWESMMPTWSADGRYVYYVTRRQDALSLWKRALDGGEPIHIVDGVFSDALESPDGKRVFFSKSTPGIWEASSNGGDAHVIPELADVVDSRYCFVNGKGLYFLAHELPPWEIRFFDFASHRVSRVANIPKTLEYFTRSLSISPDGKWMLNAQVDQIGSQIAMLSNPQ